MAYCKNCKYEITDKTYKTKHSRFCSQGCKNAWMLRTKRLKEMLKERKENPFGRNPR